ncbi:aminoglycoside 6'-N-acetyltransferase [Actinomadura graeca]|uniref:Aminoglycoside 6'-N-acetyltransferase n=1 Tax=Actinomadura graeca TaxID=2750812 RepID=A0ABX8R7T8_9ACTN|nr:aminoglycoside 6'-N-acetyltransferase [Actinomadura graeca]QXJ26032.1 aminoglycoside 6'-N-acetyltransferase [Actinomadura graeca]
MEIKGDLVVLRPVDEEDAAVLHGIVREPEVAAWWAPPEGFDGMLAIVMEGGVIGAIRYDEELDEDYRYASIDIFIGARHQGRGVGTDAVRTLARWLIRERGHHRITIDPAVVNTVAIKCYRKVGFKPVGTMREYERDPISGRWRDGLLMDLLARELIG